MKRKTNSSQMSLLKWMMFYNLALAILIAALFLATGSARTFLLCIFIFIPKYKTTTKSEAPK